MLSEHIQQKHTLINITMKPTDLNSLYEKYV